MTISQVDYPHLTQARVSRTKRRPTCIRFGRIRPWRWQVTGFELRPTETGARSRYWHLYDDHGFAMTKTGARLAAGRRLAGDPNSEVARG